jgi:hypothetical protein
MHVVSRSAILMYKKDTGSRRLSVSDSGATVGESEEATCARGSSLLGSDSTPQGQSGIRSTASHIWETVVLFDSTCLVQQRHYCSGRR